MTFPFIGVVPPIGDDIDATPSELVVLEDSGVGSGSFVPGQKNNIGAAATLIVDVRLGTPGIGRKYLNILNTGTVAVFLGGPTVSITTGSRLLVGERRLIETTQALYGVVATGTGAVDFDETI
jgi:hypothetical protein